MYTIKKQSEVPFLSVKWQHELASCHSDRIDRIRMETNDSMLWSNYKEKLLVKTKICEQTTFATFLLVFWGLHWTVNVELSEKVVFSKCCYVNWYHDFRRSSSALGAMFHAIAVVFMAALANAGTLFCRRTTDTEIFHSSKTMPTSART